MILRFILGILGILFALYVVIGGAALDTLVSGKTTSGLAWAFAPGGVFFLAMIAVSLGYITYSVGDFLHSALSGCRKESPK